MVTSTVHRVNEDTDQTTSTPHHATVAVSRKQRHWRETFAGYGFLTPWLIGFFGLTLGPMLYSLYLSFTQYNLFQPPQWIGLDNYVRLFTEDPNFTQSVKITLIYVLVGTPIGSPPHSASRCS
ncbi:hypothetical protein GCM10025876_10110 [Demequina litorisediminis]|uniref:Uncharacterized protein n=1 Tax=Demequina litorisediminis TaxID=1849022 RepID=A0ABQ6ICS2_9MICO|nr:hypothetical protein GCM10025876_10110 [Demequina litorisediminis]